MKTWTLDNWDTTIFRPLSWRWRRVLLFQVIARMWLLQECKSDQGICLISYLRLTGRCTPTLSCIQRSAPKRFAFLQERPCSGIGARPKSVFCGDYNDQDGLARVFACAAKSYRNGTRHVSSPSNHLRHRLNAGLVMDPPSPINHPSYLSHPFFPCFHLFRSCAAQFFFPLQGPIFRYLSTFLHSFDQTWSFRLLFLLPPWFCLVWHMFPPTLLSASVYERTAMEVVILKHHWVSAVVSMA